MAGEVVNGSIEELIRVTEARATAEERVRTLLVQIESGQGRLRGDVNLLSTQVEMLSRCVSGVQQMIAVIAEYMAVVAGRDSEQAREIVQQMMAKNGISFAEGAQVDIGGDMAGGDKRGGG